MTFRNHQREVALPMRQWEAFLPGTGLGGCGVHWNGQAWRYQEADFIYKTHIEQRYGKKILDPDLRIQDWGVTYQELEPYYDRFEHLLGVCGKAGNLNGKIEPGGNPLEAPRSREYPNPPMKEQYSGALFRRAALELGYHPFLQPSANTTRPYTNPEGMTLNPCVYCGFCERYGCEHFAKASPQTVILPVLMKNPNFELRTESQVLRINLDSTGKKATGVSYMDAQGREFEQPASLVLLTSRRRCALEFLHGGRGQRNRHRRFQRRQFRPQFPRIYWRMLRAVRQHERPPGRISSDARWGRKWKDAVRRHYNHTAIFNLSGTSTAMRGNYLDLDPTYRDVWGLPLLRITFDFPDNDVRMSRFVTHKASEIAQRMGAKTVVDSPRTGPFTTTSYQSTHNTGGAVIGADPSTSVVNRYCQNWDVPNVFVVGACNYPQNSSYKPTVTLGALIYWTGNGDGIIQKYSHDGKLLMQIGERGVVDTSDGTLKGRALNSSHTQFYMPSDIAVDPVNGNVYVADGYGNSRIVVFDRSGKFLRQWGHQGTKEEADAGVGGAFMQVVHCVVIGNDGLVYVCDRQGDRIQVFDKTGNFKNNIWIKRGNSLPDNWGTTWWIGFSPDREQKYMYVDDGGDEQVKILDHG